MSKEGYIQRYLLIIRLIRNNRFISLPELMRKVEDGLACTSALNNFLFPGVNFHVDSALGMRRFRMWRQNRLVDSI